MILLQIDILIMTHWKHLHRDGMKKMKTPLFL